MLVGGYSLHLYCACCNKFDQNNENWQTFKTAWKELSGRGWHIVNKDCRCRPRCSRIAQNTG